MQRMIDAVGHTDKRIDPDLLEKFQEIDINGDGMIDRDEFIIYIYKTLEMTRDEIIKVFEQ
eukprot:CAMPEP_0116960680 /NCGR_PEP_ID=MMETSP0467-20121206/46100_1 /TAXON_ID=283647 /ORGANISM="Mesodinium pulex, Strain SPMC105" /LENGTH=60 /DNA_ID=CAMNT_0004648445 /DNA_START=153 /DNA_END=335 /DNA_ORIENTATION=+